MFGCCCCKDGAIVDLWKNETLVRLAGGTVAPFARLDADTYAADHPSGPACTLGLCGVWLRGGDTNGLSEQEIDGITADIIACAAPDATHSTDDHNCYVKDGLIDLTGACADSAYRNKRFGGQWFNALHYWRGMPALTSRDYNIASNAPCSDVLSHSPDQTLYRTMDIKCAEVATLVETAHLRVTNIGDGTLKVNIWNRYTYSGEANRNQNTSVGALTGIITATGLDNNTLQFSQESASSTDDSDPVYGAPIITSPDSGFLQPVAGPQSSYQTWNADCDGKIFFGHKIGTVGGYVGLSGNATEITAALQAQFTGSWATTPTPTPDGRTATLTDYTLSGTLLSIKFEITGFNSSYAYDGAIIGGDPTVYHVVETWVSTGKITFSLVVTLSDGYTSSQALADAYALLQNVDMSDFVRAKLRTDEQLANGLLAMYDAATNGGNYDGGSTTPYTFPPLTMDDYSGTISGGVWPQRDWLDPNSYIWKWPNGSFDRGTQTGGATLITGMRTGEVIGYNRVGGQRHFWFDYIKLRREAGSPSGFHWVPYEHGGFSQSPLPLAAKRWMDNLFAQSDNNLTSADVSTGNQPQDWIRQIGQQIVVGKYCEAAQPWPAVNYGRPCGPDRYDVDQTLVGCVAEAGSGYFNILSPSSSPPVTTGYPISGYIIVTGGTGVPGVYPVTGGSVSGAYWQVNVGAKIEDVPPGWTHTTDGDYLGWLRFYTVAPGICGRVAVTTTDDGATVTIHTTPNQPYIRVGDVVDLCNTSMGIVTNGGSLTILTRAGDNTFTAAVAGHVTGSVWMQPHGTDWTKFNETPKRTGVRLVWTFDQRGAAKATADQPAWLGGTGAGTGSGLVGCTGLSVTQFSYDLAKCKAVILTTPYYSGAPVENFTNQVSFAMPTIAFDLVYGSYHIGAIEMTMVDPFWQKPFTADCYGDSAYVWKEDDGSGQLDATDGSVKIYPYRRLVEASSTFPAGCSLPSPLVLYYGAGGAGATIAPPYYPYGIPIGNDAGDFGNVWRPWGLTKRYCDTLPGNRFAGIYATFITCP